MKTIGIIILALVLGMVCAQHQLQAQRVVVGGFNNIAAPVPIATPIQTGQGDTIVQITAEAQGLQRLSPDTLPRTGTYWLVMNGAVGPFPCPPTDPAIPVYAISSDQFLVDETTGGQVVVNPRRLATQSMSVLVNAALESEATMVVNLIAQVQATEVRRQMRALARASGLDDPSLGGDGLDGGGDGSASTGGTVATFDHAQLWLEPTNVNAIPDWTIWNLHHATNFVYAIWSTTNAAMPCAGWQVETEVFPTDTNCQPFTVPTLGRPILFLRAEDWTGVDSDGDGIPDWWIWKYFGNLSENATNLDADNNSLLSDYTNNVIPNVFNFSGVEVANNYVNSSPAAGQLDVSGNPYYIATLVDDTNFADAVWNIYTSPNVTVNLGTTEGWHEVWIGLRGHADATNAVIWQRKRLKLDWTPPALIITNPISGTVDVPMIQLQGYSPEALSSISYDLSNAAGTVANQQVLVLNQSYDTTTWEFTTNHFQALDVVLTNGLNTITLYATDLAGNTTTASYSVTLDYSAKTNPPNVQLLWPLDGMEICGSNIVCRGCVSDPTVTVTAQLVDANGQTNAVGSLVGRDGLFYADNLTLAAGTNHLSFTVTDAAGNITTTNIAVATSDLGLTLDPVVAGQAVMTGTIDDDSYMIYVNGVTATNNADGTWTALITPISGTGGAVVVKAVKDGDGPSWQQAVPPPQGVYIAFSHYKQSEFYSGNEYQQSESHWWDDSGGSATGQSFDGWAIIDTGITWLASPWPEAVPWGILWATNNGQNVYHTMRPAEISFHYEHANVMPHDAVTGSSFTEVADGALEFATGGPLGSKAQRLWQFSGSVTVHHNPVPDLDEVPWFTLPNDEVVADERVSLGKLGHLDATGNVYALLEDNVRVEVTPKIDGADDYSFPAPGAQIITLNSLTVESNSASVIDATNCAAVKTLTNDWVYVKANLSRMDDTNAANLIQWSPSNLELVPGDPFQRRVSKTISAKTTVTATLGSTSTNLNVWIIWADLTVKIGTNQTIDPADHATNFLQNGCWPTNYPFGDGNNYGGGSNLGPIDYLSYTHLTIGYAVGRMEAKAILQPSGIGNLLTNASAWNMGRWVIAVGWDNGIQSIPSIPTGYYDAKNLDTKCLIPESGILFSLDAPACSANGNVRINIEHTSELYANFYQYVTIRLGGVVKICSDMKNWSYEVQIDVDSTNKVQANVLSPSLIDPLPTNSIYNTRL